MRVTYHGPHDGVELPMLHQVVVERGSTIEVDDALGAALVEQSCWDTSRDEILGWLNHVEDLDSRIDWARRLLTAERDGAQRTDVLEALEYWLKAQTSTDDPGSDVVPAGTVDEVLAWVGDDPARAAAALEAELSGKNRASLITALSAKETD